MKTIKGLFAWIAGVALIAIAPMATAQVNPPQSTYQVLLSSIALAPSSATNVAAVIDVSYQKTVGIMLMQVGGNQTNETGVVGYLFTRSVDGVNYDTVGSYITVSQVATAKPFVLTNLDCQGANYIKLNYITNAAVGNWVTNSLNYGVKKLIP